MYPTYGAKKKKVAEQEEVHSPVDKGLGSYVPGATRELQFGVWTNVKHVQNKCCPVPNYSPMGLQTNGNIHFSGVKSKQCQWRVVIVLKKEKMFWGRWYNLYPAPTAGGQNTFCPSYISSCPSCLLLVWVYPWTNLTPADELQVCLFRKSKT